MSRILCVRKFEFDSGHRVIGHGGKCRYLHGHRYSLEVHVSCDQLNNLGMVIDFAVLKDVIKTWLDNHFDHTVILSTEDQTLGDVISAETGQDIYYIPYNPTAENIALYLKEQILPSILRDEIKNSGLHIEKIRLYETPNCFVEIL